MLAVIKKSACTFSLSLFIAASFISSMLTYKYSTARGSARVMYRQTRIEYALRSVYSRPARETLQKWLTWLQPPFFIPRFILFPCLLSLAVPRRRVSLHTFVLYVRHYFGCQFLLKLTQKILLIFVYAFVCPIKKRDSALLQSDFIVRDEKEIRYIPSAPFSSRVNIII